MHDRILFNDGGLEVHGSFKKRNGNGQIKKVSHGVKLDMKYI